jgi:hypothetical protein
MFTAISWIHFQGHKNIQYHIPEDCNFVQKHYIHAVQQFCFLIVEKLFQNNSDPVAKQTYTYPHTHNSQQEEQLLKQCYKVKIDQSSFCCYAVIALGKRKCEWDDEPGTGGCETVWRGNHHQDWSVYNQEH